MYSVARQSFQLICCEQDDVLDVCLVHACRRPHTTRACSSAVCHAPAAHAAAARRRRSADAAGAAPYKHPVGPSHGCATVPTHVLLSFWCFFIDKSSASCHYCVTLSLLCHSVVALARSAGPLHGAFEMPLHLHLDYYADTTDSTFKLKRMHVCSQDACVRSHAAVYRSGPYYSSSIGPWTVSLHVARRRARRSRRRTRTHCWPVGRKQKRPRSHSVRVQ